ncbi:AGE family epimerase/isomerase [Paenibacillus koleovorans]|uniref:AGE family epimerase/isomerase n=1 Tax=Paenibacillus koleovorans TaxID=121608 RepID=UPI000FDBC7CC|nr:AGE family epimerase/isomerase [Paenibacillus koleovorans]
MQATFDRKKELLFYKEHVEKQLLPFWHKAVDERYGGMFTCFSNDGTVQVSRDKYTWSQGRYVWLWSRLADCCRRGLFEGDAERYLRQAGEAVRFLQAHGVLESGNCAFLLAEDGTPKEPIAGKGYDTSFFADCFVVMGASEYARVSGEAEALAWALERYDSIRRRLEAGTQRSEPYPTPAGLEAHSVPMIMLNVAQELAAALEAAGHSRAGEVRGDAAAYMDRILTVFVQPDYTVAELVAVDERLDDTVLARHLNPGHAIECMWFVLAEAKRLGRTDAVKAAVNVTKKAFAMGWDEQYGGLLHYVDREGGAPQGREIGDGFERNVVETWETKLWWPHSEALYTLLLADAMTGCDDAELHRLYELTQAYTFATFPQPDPAIGEWIQIRDRAGEPLTKVVALPVKDPYHILRNLILIVELLNEQPK